MNKKESHTKMIRQLAGDLGFAFCGISKARRLDEEAPRLEKWLMEKRHGEMAWMENHFEKRLDPRLLVDGAKSVISLMISYYPTGEGNYSSPLKVSKYAWGSDYHYVIKEKLRLLTNRLEAEAGSINYRIFVDSAPVLDRAWAVNAGIGWIGKNTMLISRRNGSYFFLAEIITDLELEYDNPFGGNYCGDCTRCIDACPTGAITGPRQLDASRCISYLTIELKESIPEEFKSRTENWIFGCDICQDVCPWNRFSLTTNEPAFHPSGKWTGWSREEWGNLEKLTFTKVFGRSPVMRAGFMKLKNSISFVSDFERE